MINRLLHENWKTIPEILSGKKLLKNVTLQILKKPIFDLVGWIVLETAGCIVAKCNQTLVWITKFIPKDRQENEFGQPILGRGYCMFSAYL